MEHYLQEKSLKGRKINSVLELQHVDKFPTATGMTTCIAPYISKWEVSWRETSAWFRPHLSETYVCIEETEYIRPWNLCIRVSKGRKLWCLISRIQQHASCNILVCCASRGSWPQWAPAASVNTSHSVQRTKRTPSDNSTDNKNVFTEIRKITII